MKIKTNSIRGIVALLIGGSLILRAGPQQTAHQACSGSYSDTCLYKGSQETNSYKTCDPSQNQMVGGGPTADYFINPHLCSTLTTRDDDHCEIGATVECGNNLAVQNQNDE